VKRDDVPEGLVTAEREIFETQARNEGKPENVLDRIVDGKLNAFFKDKVLYEQQFINPEKYEGTVGEMVESMAGTMGENIMVRRFSRISVGGD
jgi:elongation factor Ts